MSRASKPLKGVFQNPQSQNQQNAPNAPSHSQQSTTLPNEDLGLHRTQLKSSTFEQLSKVLLVIFNSGETKTNQDLFDLFSPYVRVIRVLIFERKEPNTKCFVEMVTLQEATYVKNQFAFQKAKNPLQKHVQIYYAQIQSIDLQNHYSEGQDFSSFYAKNPNYSCQFFQDCDISLQKIPSSTSFLQQSPHFTSQQQQQQQGQSPSYSYFGKQGGGQANQFQMNQSFAQQNQDQNETAIFDQSMNYNDGNNQGTRPQSISMVDHSMQNYHPQNRHHLVPSQSQFSMQSQNHGTQQYRHTVHSQITHEHSAFASKVYAHIPTDNQEQQLSQQSKTMTEKKRNAQADQFHKDLLKKDGILQSHINQQFQNQSMSLQMQKELRQQSFQLINSPSLHPTNQQNNQNFLGSQQKELSQSSSINRSPSSTSYTMPYALQSFQQQQQNCDLSDVDENVQVSQPQTFRTKYRDEMFFNGACQGEDSNQGQSKNINGFQEDEGQEAKRVLFVRHLDYPELKISMIYNLFSNYGNIVKIIFLKQKRQALIEFESTSQSSIAKEHLNNLMYYGAQVKIDYSKYDQIDLQKKKLHSGETNDQEQVLSIPPQCFRYKQKKVIPQYSPKSTLHVSNIRKEYFDSGLLYEFFASSGAKISSLKLIPNEKKQMCLIQFETLDDALRVISTLHDTPFHGRNLCISFTKSSNQIQQNNTSINNNSSFNNSQLKHFSQEQQRNLPNQQNSIYKQLSGQQNSYQGFLPQDADQMNLQQNLLLYQEAEDDEDYNQEDYLEHDIQAQILNLGI